MHGHTLKFIALTCIDPVTNLLEIVRSPDKSAESAWCAFEKSWLCRYPRPLRCLHDGGPEFMGNHFQLALDKAGIKSKGFTAQNPQSNGICERIHQTVGLVIRTLVHLSPPLLDQAIWCRDIDESPTLRFRVPRIVI